MQTISLKYKTNYYSLLLIGFILPLYKNLIPVSILLFAITSFINHRWKKDQKENFSKGKMIWLLPLFIIYLISVLYSTDQSVALTNIETKLSLLIFPLLFYITDLDLKKVTPSLFKSFIEGSFIAVILSFVQAFVHYIYSGDAGYFLYMKFSYFSHPSYFSMFLCFALATVYYYSFKPSKEFYIKPIVGFFLIILFTSSIILTSSKSGWLVLSFIHLFALSFWIIKHKNYTKGLVSIVVIATGAFVLYSSAPKVKDRVNEMFDNLFSEPNSKTLSSTQVRRMVWDISFDLIREKPIIGYGCGDSRNVLTEKYKDLNLQKLMNKRLNAHNQYLQTTLDTGIIGGIILLLSILIPITLALLKKQWIYVIFLSIVSINFFTEVMLSTQSGVIFFAFFNTLLFVLLVQHIEQNKVSTINN